jgi:hypothetical protein
MADGTEPGVSAGMPASSPARVMVELAAFCCELAMLVVLGIAGWGLGSGGLMGIAFTIFYPALGVLIWSIWVAPRSGRRLPDPLRLLVQLVLFAATGALSAAAGHPILGIVFAVIACGVFVATRFTGGVTGT